MRHRTLHHSAARRWSGHLPAELDGPQTLVLAFAAPELADAPAPLADLAAAFPRSVLLGCSTSGEIAGAADAQAAGPGAELLARVSRIHEDHDWRAAGLDAVPVAANLSSRQFADDSLMADLQAALQAHELRPADLQVELTESALMAKPERASEVLRQPAAVGPVQAQRDAAGGEGRRQGSRRRRRGPEPSAGDAAWRKAS